MERIELNLNIWSPMKKTKLKTWKSGNKTMKSNSTDAKVIELTEDRALFGRMMIITKSRPALKIKDIIGEFESSVVPRSLFAADGSMHRCSSKSDLMTVVLEKVKASKEFVDTISEENSTVIVDAMAEVQCLKNSDEVVNCADLTDAFIHKLISMVLINTLFSIDTIQNALLKSRRENDDKAAETQLHIEYQIQQK